MQPEPQSEYSVIMMDKELTHNVNTYSGCRFTWHGSHGSVDVSELGRGFLQRVWRDSCDEGFVVHSRRTGRLMPFVLYNTNVDEDGCTEVSWEFISEVENVTITVYND